MRHRILRIWLLFLLLLQSGLLQTLLLFHRLHRKLPYGLLQLRRLFRSVSGNRLPSLLHSPLLSQQNPGHLRCWKEGSPYRLLHLQDLHIHGSDHRCSHPLHLLRCLPEAALPVCGYLRELRLRCQ